MTAEQFKERFVRLYPKLFAVAMANIGNREEAKDAMQSLYMKLWEKRGELSVVDNDVGYCRTMLVNICRDRWRSMALEPEWVSADKEIPDEGLSELEHDDLKEKIERFVATLPDRQRRIMTMRMHGATTDEIIEATGLSVENIRTILSRTRQVVRDYYNKINK